LIRSASLADALEILAVANQHELRIDPDFEPYPLSEFEQQILGYSEPAHPFVFDKDGIKAAALIQIDTPRKRVEIDLFTVATEEATRELFSYALDYAGTKFPGFQIRSACNKLDVELLAIFENSGLKFYRDYYKLKKAPISSGFPNLPAGVSIQAVSLTEEGELLHRLEAESFSGHFGYVPISAADWLKERMSDLTFDHSGSFVLSVDGEPAGLLLSSDARADVQGGWVDKLGVIEKFRGRGLGKLLLQWGTAHAAQKGYTSIALGADTGNDSGALELYFSLGFEEQLSWRAYSS
jgi:ribosomal protein S18 acetylase RimI-like enzyme